MADAMRILITGGAGFLGSHLAEELSAGNEIVILDNFHTGSRENLGWAKGRDVRVLRGRASDCARLVGGKKVDAIYHFGMPSSSPMYRENPLLVGECVNGALAVLELARRNDAKVVYASTSSLYNGVEPPQGEAARILITDYYTEARLAVERLAELYAKLHGMRSAGMRFFSVYGPREKSKGKFANIVSQFMWAMQKGKAPEIFGDGRQTRDFVFVGDAVRACVLAMERKTGGVYNVGTGKATSFNGVVEKINGALGKNIRPVYVQNPIKNYVDITQADTTRAKNELGFEARIALDDGIRRLVERGE